MGNEFSKFFELIKKDIGAFKEFNVNENVISKFDCPKIVKDELSDIFKQKIEEDFRKKDDLECIELLGVFVYGEEGNILINEKRIKETSQKYNLPFDVFKDFVRIHEYSHLLMDTKQELNSNQIIFEEALATASSLKMFEDTKYFDDLKTFVEKLPFCYRYGLEFLKFNINEIIELMKTWKELNKDIVVFNSILSKKIFFDLTEKLIDDAKNIFDKIKL